MRAAQFREVITRLEAELTTANKHVEVEVMKRKQYEAEIKQIRGTWRQTDIDSLRQLQTTAAENKELRFTLGLAKDKIKVQNMIIRELKKGAK